MALQSELIERLPHVKGAVVYLANTGEPPYTYTYDPPPGVARSNIVGESHKLPIHDMRPIAANASLDREGFALLTAPTAADNLYDEEELRRTYYPEAERIVAEVTGANRVVIFDHTIRRRERGVQDRTPGTPRQP